MPPDYSGTPLIKKLGIKAGFSMYLSNQPETYFDLLEKLPKEIVWRKKLNADSIDFIHAFQTDFKTLEKNILKYKKALKKEGLLWISWPKGKSKITTDLNRDLIREFVLTKGLVDVKVASIDENWSALKFVYRLTDRV